MNDRQDIALARATLARFVAACFSESPESEPDALISPEVREALPWSASRLEISQTLVDGILESMPSADAAREARGRLLGHTVRSDCPPYELEYKAGEVFQQSQELADIAAFYRAFGLDLSGPMAERADHIVAEWEFLSIVALKESFAAKDDNKHGLECCRDAQRKFLKEHAAFWMIAFFNRLRDADPHGFFCGVASLATALLKSWCDALDIPLGPEWLDLRPVDDDDLSISCGDTATSGMVELGPRLAKAMREGA